MHVYKSKIKPILATIITFAVLHSALVLAAGGQPETIEWFDLVSPLEFSDPFQELDINQLSALRRYVQIKEVERELEQLERNEIVAKLNESGIEDIEALLEKREEIALLRKRKATEANPVLDGKSARLAGYMLPLEFDGQQVSEFLLVPTVGACIHIPPPPPNQIVHVKLEQSVPFDGLFKPVWLSGDLEIKPSTQELFLMDGSAPIDMGYAMTNAQISDYE
jgi:hypothetical protein